LNGAQTLVGDCQILGKPVDRDQPMERVRNYRNFNMIPVDLSRKQEALAMKRNWFSIFLVVVAILAVVAQPAAAISNTVVISEFRTRGLGGVDDQFIELYNLSNSPVDITGYYINAWDPTIGFEYSVAQVNGTVILQPYQHYLFVNGGGYSGSTAEDDSFLIPLFDNAVGIALFDSGDLRVDAVSTTGDAGNPYFEGTPLAPMSVDINQSYERLPGTISGAGGHINTNDSDNNSADFAPNVGSSNPESQVAGSPTAVTLRDLTAQAQPAAAWLWPLALVVALGGALIVSRRRA
jgi:hypothetical protein